MIDRRRFLAGLGATVSLPLSSALADSDRKPPNIVIILVDDMGYSDLGCYGGEIDTPTIDQLAYNGLRFTQFYNTGKCCPTRTCLLTGHYWQTVGRGIKRGVMLPEALKAAGYKTMATGKWHLNGKPWERGFDRYFGHLSGCTHYFKGDKTWYKDGERYEIPEKGFYSTDADTDYALRFIDDHYRKDSDKPFFLYQAYNAPHYPLHAKPEDIKKYRGGRFSKGWDKLREERYERQRAMNLVEDRWELPPRPDYIPAWDSLSKEEQDFEDLRMSVYAGMVDCIDQNVARIMKKLDEHGDVENTLVMFLSDNGGCPFDRNRKGTPGKPDSWWEYGVAWANVSNTPFRLYKRSQHEGGTATPCIVHWPAGLRATGEMNDTPAHLIDIFSTCMDVSGCTYHQEHQEEELPPYPGQSLLPAFQRRSIEPHENLFFHYGRHRALISGRWKLVSAYHKEWELYDLEKDRTELHNLASKRPDKVKELDAIYRKWWKETGRGSFKLGKQKGSPPKYRDVPGEV